MCYSRTCRPEDAGRGFSGLPWGNPSDPAGLQLGWAARALPAGEQPVHGAVDVEMIRLAATRYNDIRAPEESDQDASRHLEQGVTVRTGQCQGDEVAPRGRPRPDAHVADAGRLVEAGDEELAGERPAHRLAAGGLRMKEDMHGVRVGRVITQARPYRQGGR